MTNSTDETVQPHADDVERGFQDDAELVANVMFDGVPRNLTIRDVHEALDRLGMQGPILNLAAMKRILQEAERHPHYPHDQAAERVDACGPLSRADAAALEGWTGELHHTGTADRIAELETDATRRHKRIAELNHEVQQRAERIAEMLAHAVELESENRILLARYRTNLDENKTSNRVITELEAENGDMRVQRDAALSKLAVLERRIAAISEDDLIALGYQADERISELEAELTRTDRREIRTMINRRDDTNETAARIADLKAENVTLRRQVKALSASAFEESLPVCSGCGNPPDDEGVCGRDECPDTHALSPYDCWICGEDAGHVLADCPTDPTVYKRP